MKRAYAIAIVVFALSALMAGSTFMSGSPLNEKIFFAGLVIITLLHNWCGNYFGSWAQGVPEALTDRLSAYLCFIFDAGGRTHPGRGIGGPGRLRVPVCVVGW